MLSEDSISRIELLYSVARLNDSPLSLGELHTLLASDTSIVELEEAFASLPTLSTRYVLDSGFITEKGGADWAAEVQKRRRAFRDNVATAERLAVRLGGRGASVIAVGGSTSYESVKESDDLDLFCVTRGDYAWIFLTKALLLLRASRLASGEVSRACLSCVMDQNYAVRAFSSEQDPLFARDALNAMVLKGNKEYAALLRRADWMKKIFPRLYFARSPPAGSGALTVDSPVRTQSGTARRVANRFLFYVVGGYLRVKSMLESRRIWRDSGDRGRSFEARIGFDHCIYESLRYREMRAMYLNQLDQSRFPPGMEPLQRVPG